MHRMRSMRHMPAAKDLSASPVMIAVDLDSSIQSLEALDAAAYRLIGTATCQIDRVADRYVCLLVSMLWAVPLVVLIEGRALSVSQERLAHDAGIDRAYLSRVERA